MKRPCAEDQIGDDFTTRFDQIGDDFYDSILRQLKTAPEIYRPTAFWEEAGLEIGDKLRRGGVKKFRSLDGPRQYFVPNYTLEGLQFFGENVASDLQASLLKNRSSEDLSKREQHLLKFLDQGLFLSQGDYRAYIAGDAAKAEVRPVLRNCFESGLGDPLTQVTFDGRVFSRSMLNYMNGLVFLKSLVDTGACTKYLEIGGGYGTLGEILHRDSEHRYLYVNVDIPPASFAASWYLEKLYNSAGEGGFCSCLKFPSDGAPFTIDEKQCRATTLNSWQLPGLEGTFDVFVNFISFQEMEPDVVRNYAGHVKRLGCKFVLLRNLREGKKKAKVDVDAETKWGQRASTTENVTGEFVDAVFFDNGYKLVGKNVFPFGYQTVDGFHSELSVYAKSV